MAPTLGWLVAARFIDRVGKGIRGAPRDALIADITPAQVRGASFGLRQSLDTIGAFLGPLIVWLIYKDKSPFVGDQAKEALNFSLALMIAILVCFATCIGVIVVPVIGIGALVYQIIAAMESNKGVWYRYPYTIRMIN